MNRKYKDYKNTRNIYGLSKCVILFTVIYMVEEEGCLYLCEMRSIYSIVFYPSELIEAVRQMKLDLKGQIGWYHSVNSEAHITINEFEADEREYLKVCDYLQKFVCGLESREIVLDDLGIYPNGAFFLKPDNYSLIYMKEIMGKLHKTFPMPVRIKSSEPHLSIARRLESEELDEAQKMFGFQPVDFRFFCNAIAVRKFDENKKQFEVCKEFVFKPDETPQIFLDEQLSLF